MTDQEIVNKLNEIRGRQVNRRQVLSRDKSGSAEHEEDQPVEAVGEVGAEGAAGSAE